MAEAKKPLIASVTCCKNVLRNEYAPATITCYVFKDEYRRWIKEAEREETQGLVVAKENSPGHGEDVSGCALDARG